MALRQMTRVFTIAGATATLQRNTAFVCVSPALLSLMFSSPTSTRSRPLPLPRLDVYDNRGIETEIWTNLCDKYSSTGRWHAIPARRIDIHRELRGRVHSFSVSIIPIRCGMFEFTARTRAPKSLNPDWIWASRFDENESLHVIRTGSQRSGLTQGSVRQLAQWFDDILTFWYVSEVDGSASREKENRCGSVLAAYCAVFLSVIALQEGADVGLGSPHYN